MHGGYCGWGLGAVSGVGGGGQVAWVNKGGVGCVGGVVLCLLVVLLLLGLLTRVGPGLSFGSGPCGY